LLEENWPDKNGEPNYKQERTPAATRPVKPESPGKALFVGQSQLKHEKLLKDGGNSPNWTDGSLYAVSDHFFPQSPRFDSLSGHVNIRPN
jgi:hypothetical protein